MHRLLLTAVLAATVLQVQGQTGCTTTTLSSSFNRYDCDHALITSYSTTFNGASFTTPEELYINAITNFQLPNNAFSSMSSITNNTFAAVADTIPKLELQCVRNNFLYFTNQSFQGLPYIEWFSIKQCLILTIQMRTFADLETLQSFAISAGQIGSIEPDSFSGISMYTNRKVPGSGWVNLTSTIPGGNVMPGGVFAPFDGATHMDLSGMGLADLPTSVFGTQDSLTFLNLSNNKYLDLKEGTFDGFSAVSRVELFRVEMTCDCSSHTWIITWASENHVVVQSDWICTNEASSLAKYKMDVCDTHPIGFWLLDVYWYGAEKILLWIINIISFVIACVALGYLDKARLKPKLRRRPPAKDPQKPRPKGLKRAADKVRRMQRKMNLGWG